MVHISQRTVLAANISLLVLTTLFAISRLLLPIWLKRRYCYKDIWLAVALIFFVSLAVVYMVFMPIIFMLGPTDTKLMKHATIVVKVMFAAALLHWFVLWSVKFSLLALYTQLLKRANTIYTRLWWAIVVFSFMALVGSVLGLVFACGPNPSQQFQVIRCLRKSSMKGSAMSLWLGYASDVLTDILLILFPIGLIRNLNMPFRQKFSVIAIFCLALICIISATIRVFEVGKTINEEAVPDLPWLALWSLVEASIAVTIGCAAGFHELTSRIGNIRTISNTGSTHGSNVRWYPDGPVKMATLRSDLEPIDDTNSSQEQLTASVVTKNEFVESRFTLQGGQNSR